MKKWVIWVFIVLIIGASAGYLIVRQYIKAQSQPVTYTEPHAFSIAFPKSWRMDGGGMTSGYEILSLYSYDYQTVTDPGGGFNRGQIKISISIIDKDAKSLDQLVASSFKGTEKDFQKEVLKINGHKAIQVSGSFDTGEELSPMIETYIEYDNSKYAWLVGYYNGDKNSAAKIKEVVESFKALK